MPVLDHLPELIIVLLIGALVFGTKRLPEIGQSVAQTIKNFQHSMKEISAGPETPVTPTALPPATSEANVTKTPAQQQ
jgi:TatA/E family protein of Tat protein translocase